MTVKKNNEKEYALITGATRGAGYEVAKLFARDRYNLIIVARDEAELNRVSRRLQKQYGIEVIKISKDLYKPGNALDLYKEISVKGIHIEVLVNHSVGDELLLAGADDELSVIQQNISSVVVLTKLFLQDMIKQGHGKILHLSSLSPSAPEPLRSVNQGAKVFLQSFTNAIRNEVRDTGIKYYNFIAWR